MSFSTILPARDSLDFLRSNVENSLPLNNRRTDIQYIGSAVVLSLGLSQLVGPIVALAHSVQAVFNALQIPYLFVQQFYVKKRIQDLNNRYLMLFNDVEKVLIVREIKKWNDLSQGNVAAMQHAVWGLKRNTACGFASLLSVIPVIGVIAAAAFLLATGSQESQSSSYVQRGAEELAANVAHFWGSFVSQILYPLRGTGKSQEVYYGAEYYAFLQDEMRNLGAQQVEVEVERGDGQEHTIRCQRVAATRGSQAKTMILFHGNGMNGEEMGFYAHQYCRKGWDVVMVTCGGYPGSDATVYTTEETVIQDTYAVLKMLEKEGVKAIGVHGFSAGGVMALHATQLSKKVVYVVADKTFDHVRNAMANYANNRSVLGGKIPSALVRGVCGSAFPAGKMVPGVVDQEGSAYFTSGCANRDKAACYKGVLVSLGGNQDPFMGYNYDHSSQTYQSNFSEDIYLAHATHPENAGKTFGKVDNTGHCLVGSLVESQVAFQAIEAALEKADQLIDGIV